MISKSVFVLALAVVRVVAMVGSVSTGATVLSKQVLFLYIFSFPFCFLLVEADLQASHKVHSEYTPLT